MSRPNGRPPVPTELKLFRGNPGRRSLAGKVKGDIPANVPAPPPSLGEAGRAAWVLYWTHGRAWLALTDLSILTQLCETHDEADVLAKQIREEGLTHVSETSGRSVVHYLYNDLRGLRREMRELWSLCYMTPTDRGRANVKVTEVDALEAWSGS